MTIIFNYKEKSYFIFSGFILDANCLSLNYDKYHRMPNWITVGAVSNLLERNSDEDYFVVYFGVN